MDIILRSFINRLESLPDKPSLDVLKKCILEMDGRQLPIDEYVSFSDKDYKRNIVHVSSKCEFTVLCFKKGQITPIHDHGGSIGITIIREGTMTEELFDKQHTGIIVPSLNRKFHAGGNSLIRRGIKFRQSFDRYYIEESNLQRQPPLTLMNI